MAWVAPLYMDLWPGATDEEAREWWEGFRAQHNAFAEAFNKDWLNRIWIKLGKVHPIELAPTYDEMIAKREKGNES